MPRQTKNLLPLSLSAMRTWTAASRTYATALRRIGSRQLCRAVCIGRCWPQARFRSSGCLDTLALLSLGFLGMKGQALKGHLDLLVLAVLAEGPRHGYGVIEELRLRSGEEFDLPEGTVYPVLHRLQQAGLLASEWREVAGRRRRTYRLTEAGRAALVEQRSAWESFSTAVGSVLRGVPWPSTT